MDYKRLYEQSLERARVWKDKSGMPADKQGILDDIFPELAESEDERIRKEIIAWLKNSEGQTLPIDRYNAALAWLEKQGEQKPTIEMKSAEESLGIDSDTYNEIVDECIYGEQKSWSEEDEKMINDAISFISHSAFKTIGKGKKNTISWLKSLKDRVQPKQEWSEDDDDKFFFLKTRLKDYEDCIIYDEELSMCQKHNVRETTKEFLKWLDSIKERIGGKL